MREGRVEVGECRRFERAVVVVVRLWGLDSEVVRLLWLVLRLKTWFLLFDGVVGEVCERLLSWLFGGIE